MKLIFSFKQFVVFILQFSALLTYHNLWPIDRYNFISLCLLCLLVVSLFINLIFALSAKNPTKNEGKSARETLQLINKSDYSPNYNH